MDSLKHLEAVRKIESCQVCGKPGNAVMHLTALGSGSNRKKPNVRHFLTLKACQECHDLYDGRTTSKCTDWLTFQGRTGINVWKLALENMIKISGVNWRDIARATVWMVTGERP